MGGRPEPGRRHRRLHRTTAADRARRDRAGRAGRRAPARAPCGALRAHGRARARVRAGAGSPTAGQPRRAPVAHAGPGRAWGGGPRRARAARPGRWGKTALTDVVIVNAVRSAVGKRRGTLSSYEAPDLLGDVYRGLLDGAAVAPDVVEQVVAGCVSQVGEQSGNVARNAWLGAGLPLATAASTINAQCGSGQQAVTLVHGLIAAGLVDVAIAGGVE